jgi:hypothetical protein
MSFYAYIQAKSKRSFCVMRETEGVMRETWYVSRYRRTILRETSYFLRETHTILRERVINKEHVP